MNTTYYGLLREVFSPNVKLVKKNFTVIVNVSDWILTPEWVEPKDLSKDWIPFIGIKTRKNFWLVDLTRVYNRIITQASLSAGYPVYLTTPEGILVSNYNILGEVYPGSDNYDNPYISSIDKTYNEYKLDFIIQIKSIYAVEKDRERIRIRIHPQGFVMRDYYLCHKIYDDANKLTLGYILKVLKPLFEIAHILNLKIKAEFSQEIDTKENFLGYLETKALPLIFKKAGLQYTPTGGDIEKRTQNIKTTLQKLKKMIT